MHHMEVLQNAVDRFNLRVNTMDIVLRKVRGGRACRILAMGSHGACPLFDFLGQLKRDDGNAFDKITALLDRTANHGTLKNEQKYRYFKREKVFEFKTTDGVRVLGFWDEKHIIVCSHGFLKKSQKTPPGEIKRVVEVRREYFAAKEQGLLKEVK